MRQFHVVTLLASSTFSRASEDFDEAGLALLQDLDGQGLIDWHARNEQGWPFLHALIEGRERTDVLSWVLDRYGPDLLTQTDQQGRSLFDVALGKKHVQSLVLFTERATPGQLAWHDQPGEPFGEGWYQRFRTLNEPAPLRALIRRGIAPETDGLRLARTVQHLTQETFELLLEQGLSPDASIEITPGFHRPLWAQAIDRHIPVTQSTTPLPNHADIGSWEALRQKEPSRGKSFVAKDDLLKELSGLSQKGHTRDDLGRPALWLAVLRNPGLIGDTLARYGDLFSAKDHQGHGFWFHAYALLNTSEWPASRDLPGLPLALHEVTQGQSLVAQWFTEPAASFLPLSLPFAKAPARVVEGISMAQAWASSLTLWDMDPSTREQVAQVWLEGTHPALKGLAETCAVWLKPWSPPPAYRYGPTPPSQPGPWQPLVASPEWAPLRAPLAVVLWRGLVEEAWVSLRKNSGSTPVANPALMQALDLICALPWQALPPAFVEGWAAEVQASPPGLQALGERLGDQMRAMNRAVELQHHSVPALPPRPRRFRA